MIKHLVSPVKFREDINGLRAWAVFGVLLFHFELIGLPGGFAGVDMFFVISGYLMTAIVTSGLEKGNFSFLKFYMSRVRRILPALMVVILALLLFGWYWLPTIDYKVLSTQSISTLGFVSNIYYYLKTGYFEVSAHENWLLHTWSLAVEAQFYLIYPIILYIFWKIKSNLKSLMIGIVIIFIISLGINLFYSFKDPSAAFYLLPMRGWELASGGIVYLIIRLNIFSDKFSNIAFFSGWSLIIGSLFFIDKNLLWPSYWALLPVLGVSLVILANNQKSILTDNFIFQWVGDRSYSLYLWHWPLVVGLFFTGLNNSWFYVILAFLVSILLGHLSFWYIEAPTRKLLSKSNLFKEVVLIGVFMIFLLSLAFIVRSNQFVERLPNEIEIAAKGRLDFNPRRDECLGSSKNTEVNPCTYGEGKISVILLGDSHSDSLITSLYKVSKNSVLQLSLRACPVLLDAKISPWIKNADYPACMNLLEFLKTKYLNQNDLKNVPIVYVTRASEYISYKIQKNNNTNIELVKPMIYFNDKPVMNSNTDAFRKEFSDSYVKTVCKFQKNRQVYILRPIPEMSADAPRILSRNIMFNRKEQDIKISLENYYEKNKFVWEVQDEAVKQCGVKLLNPLPYLCDDKFCYGSKNGKSLYIDDNHLSEYGNSFLQPMFEEIFMDYK